MKQVVNVEIPQEAFVAYKSWLLMINSVLRRAMPIIFCSAGVFIALVTLLVLGAVDSQWRRDRDYERKLAPSIAFVESFESKYRRLPSDAEFGNRPSASEDWMVDLITSDSADAAFKAHGGKTKNDFAVRIWRGEQWTYYFSGSREYDIIEPNF